MQGFWQYAVVQDCTIWSNPHNTAQFLHNIENWALEFLEINVLLFITTLEDLWHLNTFVFAFINPLWRLFTRHSFFYC